jgi:hypothetical protein
LLEVNHVDRVADVELEDDVLGEDVLDGRDDVFRFPLGEFDRFRAALEDGTVFGEFGNLRELLRVG